MNTAKIYKNSEGVDRTIWQMVKEEPEWAANRVQAGESAINSLQQLKAEIAALATDLECHSFDKFNEQMYRELRKRLRQLSAV